ncbi:MAG: deoxynucleoside kinase [Acidobacteria bacterium]|nr:deoxynucleoside kinase [Acidobacteriota bacterium]MCG2817144.1 deoxynucleoside kinase [Candidatus Aminicenantes bacterium]MBU1338585.1 deoxynucleoside kinase [Acidobacteriota bacterium]MBU1475648.1 deoxynucleoside kinase [Acidobacteriota bacterium]MBU2437991.1 deoxynucleoside kinase [Acidobacteriota bacterium]
MDEITFNHIAIEGMLKSNKAGLANALAKQIGGKVIFDITENPYLKDFYDEKEGASFLAQLVFLVNRYHQQSALLQRGLFDERIICDYLYEKDKIYAYQILTDDELVVYERIYTILKTRVTKPDLVIYLQLSLPTLRRRIAKYGTPLEKNISTPFLEDMLEAFDYFFFNYKSAPLLVVKSDNLDFTRQEDMDDLIEKIIHMKKSPLFYVPLGDQNKKGSD